MIETLLKIIVLLSVFLVVYHHLLYPLFLNWIHKRKKINSLEIIPRSYTPNSRDEILPTVTIVIPAYNEQHWIAEKIRNLAVLDYPEDRLKIIIACDGCTDNTAASARNLIMQPECSHLSVDVREYKVNRGKVAVLNDVIEGVDSELVALSDVSALISVDALLIADAHFNDEKVGVLNSHYHLLNPSSVGEATYWQYQSNIKESESHLGSTLGAHGAFYILRRSLYTPLAPDTINDDFILPMKIVAQGYRAEYEGRIQALELEKSSDKMDHHRRRRIAAGNFQQILRLKSLMLPSYGGVAFTFISGKGLRVLMPFFMLIAFFGSIVLGEHSSMFLLLAAIQLLAYLLAAWQIIFKPTKSHRALQALAYLVNGHIAGLIGALRYMLGLERGCWKPVS